MLHGAAGSGAMFGHHTPELARTYRVIAPDLRGMGQSEHVSSLPPDGWIEDVRALIDHLGIGSAHIYGISLGSRIAMRLAVDYPAYVRSLILEQPLIAIEEAANNDLNAEFSNF